MVQTRLKPSRSRPCQFISSCVRWANARSITATPPVSLPLAWCGRQRLQGCRLEQLLARLGHCSRPCFMHARIILAMSLAGPAAGTVRPFLHFSWPISMITCMWKLRGRKAKAQQTNQLHPGQLFSSHTHTQTDRAHKAVGWSSRCAVNPFVPGLLKNCPALRTGRPGWS